MQARYRPTIWRRRMGVVVRIIEVEGVDGLAAELVVVVVVVVVGTNWNGS